MLCPLFVAMYCDCRLSSLQAESIFIDDWHSYFRLALQSESLSFPIFVMRQNLSVVCCTLVLVDWISQISTPLHFFCTSIVIGVVEINFARHSMYPGLWGYLCSARKMLHCGNIGGACIKTTAAEAILHAFTSNNSYCTHIGRDYQKVLVVGDRAYVNSSGSQFNLFPHFMENQDPRLVLQNSHYRNSSDGYSTSRRYLHL